MSGRAKQRPAARLGCHAVVNPASSSGAPSHEFCVMPPGDRRDRNQPPAQQERRRQYIPPRVALSVWGTLRLLALVPAPVCLHER